MNNEDDKFFNQFLEAPREEFSRRLFQRINTPMNNYPAPNRTKKFSMAAIAVTALLVVTLMFSSPVRAAAKEFLLKIGFITITAEVPPQNLPTAVPYQAEVNVVSSVGEATTLAGFNVVSPGFLPKPYTFSGTYSISTDAYGTTVSSIYLNQDLDSFLLLNQTLFNEEANIDDYVTADEKIVSIKVNGHQGVFISNRWMTNPIIDAKPEDQTLRATNWLRWQDNMVIYTLISDQFSSDELLKIAKDLQ